MRVLCNQSATGHRETSLQAALHVPRCVPCCARDRFVALDLILATGDIMKVALFVPCFIDAFFPDVAVATLELLERFGCDVDYPHEQTCCVQPMGNSGCEKDAAATEKLFVKNFAGYDYIVAPSGSCVHHVRDHLTAVEPSAQSRAVRANTYELVEFLHDLWKVDAFPWAAFAHKV